MVRDGRATAMRSILATGMTTAVNALSRPVWHGTHIAGIIGAVGNNSTGIIGVAYGAGLLVRVLGVCGGFSSTLLPVCSGLRGWTFRVWRATRTLPRSLT